MVRDEVWVKNVLSQRIGVYVAENWAQKRVVLVDLDVDISTLSTMCMFLYLHKKLIDDIKWPIGQYFYKPCSLYCQL